MRLVARLMRLYKPTGQIDVMAEQPCLECGDYRWLWLWIGGEYGAAHPHPDCKYWVEDGAATAQFTGEEHIIRSDN